MAQLIAQPTVVVEHPVQDVVRIILNRPHSLNAINAELLHGLVLALRANASARIIILEGSGDRSFCAGEDLKQSLTPTIGSAEELRDALNKLQDITRLTSSANSIVIAAVQGYAVGGGAEIALAADFVIGSPRATFRFPEAAIGHAVTGGISARLVPLVGLLKAKELLLTGRFITAKEALSIGLLNEIAENPKTRALQLACELVKLPATALTASKTTLEKAVFPNMESSLHDEVEFAAHCFAQAEAKAAFSNFAFRNTKNIDLSDQSTSYPSTSDLTSVEVKDTGLMLQSQKFSVPQSKVLNINNAWQDSVRKYPNRVFLRFGDQDIVFKDFDKRIAQFAGGLRALGVGHRDRLLVMMENSAEMVLTWFAANRLGAVWVPINTQLKFRSLTHVIQAASPKLALVDNTFYSDLAATKVLEPNVIWINGIESSNSLSRIATLGSAVYTPMPVPPLTASAYLYTSGTTGRSKPCMLSHEYFIHSADALIMGCGLHQKDVLYCPFPLYHVDATALTIIPAMIIGATAAISARFSASKFWDEIRLTRATVYDFMGATLALAYKQPPSLKDRDHHVRLAWGVPIPSFAPEYEKRFGHKLVTLYGSVESGLPIFQDRSQPLPLQSCGRIRKGFQIRIADSFDRELPPSTPGNILLRTNAPGAFFDGYFNDEASTVAAFKNMWLHTGDIGKVDKDGNVFFLGRTKDVIRRRGENINAVEVEEHFLQHPDVTIAAAIPVPSELGNGTEEEVKAVIQLKPGRMTTEKDLWEWAIKNMARFQVPLVIQIVDEIPRTSTGKMEKHKLKVEGGSKFNIPSASRTLKL